MQQINVYQYKINDLTITSSSVPSGLDYVIYTRLIADKGKALTTGDGKYSYVETTLTPEIWQEVDDPLLEQ